MSATPQTSWPCPANARATGLGAGRRALDEERPFGAALRRVEEERLEVPEREAPDRDDPDRLEDRAPLEDPLEDLERVAPVLEEPERDDPDFEEADREPEPERDAETVPELLDREVEVFCFVATGVRDSLVAPSARRVEHYRLEPPDGRIRPISPSGRCSR